MSLDNDELDEQELSAIEVSPPQPDPAAERAELAQEILNEIGDVEVDYRLGITDDAAAFVEDMQARLEESQTRKILFRCSERQLEWLEGIREKLEG